VEVRLKDMLKNIMVCVTQQKTCENLIKIGYEIFKEEKCDSLYVIHVVNENEKLLFNLSDGEALEYLFEITKDLGADLVVKRSKNVISTLVDFAIEKKITHIIMGSASELTATNNFEQRLRRKLPEIQFVI
jgi:K+-sensing histidine kinase KdpD